MKKLKTFFYVLKKSISSPSYYREVINTKIGFSIKYFLVLAALSSLIFSCIVSIKGVPETRRVISSFIEQAKNIYPNDLTIDVKEGKWSINQPEPYVIPMPDFDEEGEENIPQNLVVFDKKGTIEDLEKYDTVIILNETNVIYREGNGKTTAQAIKDMPDFNVDKSNVSTKLDELNNYLRFIPYLVPVLLFGSDLLFNYIGEGVFHVLFAGSIIYLLSLIRKDKINYKQSCQIIIHTMTIPILMQLVLRFTEYNTLIKGWFFILNILIAAIFMVRMNKDTDLVKIEKREENLN